MVINLPDDTVGAFTYDILDVVLLADVEGDLASSASLCAAHFDVSRKVAYGKPRLSRNSKRCGCFADSKIGNTCVLV